MRCGCRRKSPSPRPSFHRRRHYHHWMKSCLHRCSYWENDTAQARQCAVAVHLLSDMSSGPFQCGYTWLLEKHPREKQSSLHVAREKSAGNNLVRSESFSCFSLLISSVHVLLLLFNHPAALWFGEASTRRDKKKKKKSTPTFQPPSPLHHTNPLRYSQRRHQLHYYACVNRAR